MSDAAVPTSQGGIAPLSAAARNYALTLLLAIYTINFLDRSIITILAEPIRNELHLQDWQLGVMTGFAFAVFYTFLGVPIARFAERNNRPFIIAGALTLWSGFTALSGLAQNFVQLCMARIGVGVGEAGCTPPAHSLITDYVPKEQRASALAFYSLGVPIGSLIGLAAGGVLADTIGWRNAFMLAGAPGLVFAVLIVFTLREPRTRAVMAHIQTPQTSFGDVMKALLKKRTFWLIAFGAAVNAFIGYGQAPFNASFFLRVHGDEVATLAAGFGLQAIGFLGLALGLISGVSAILSTLAGGVVADFAAKRDLRAAMTVPALGALIYIPSAAAVYLAPTAGMALLISIIPNLVGSLWYGPVYATTQGVVPPHMRATAASMLLFIINIVGLGAGPLVVGIISDTLANGFGFGAAEGVRWALVVSVFFALISMTLFLLARRTIREDVQES